MDWNSSIKGFKSYLQLERSLSKHSIDAYLHDVQKLCQFVIEEKDSISAIKLNLRDLRDFITWLDQFKIEARSQARIISGIKAFYKYLLMEDLLEEDPTELLAAPKLGKYILGWHATCINNFDNTSTGDFGFYNLGAGIQ